MLLEKRASGSERKSCDLSAGAQWGSGRGRRTYEVITSDVVGLTPGAHDVGIVVGKDGNNVDTLGLELGELLGVLGDVASRADRGESTGEGEEDDLLVGPLLGGVVVDGDTASLDLLVLLSPGDVAIKQRRVSGIVARSRAMRWQGGIARARDSRACRNRQEIVRE